MKKYPSIIGCLRPSMLGDIVLSSIFTHYLNKVYQGCYQVAYIDKKCSQIIPFLINHPFIDKIYISEEVDRVSPKDEEYFKQFNMVFEPFVPHVNERFYNEKHAIQESFEMNWHKGHGRINPNQFNVLTENEKCPRFSQWFDADKNPGYIAIWPFSGYNVLDPATLLRSPEIKWWVETVKLIKKLGKIAIQLGHPKSPLIYGIDLDMRELSLFEAIKVSIGCDISISTDSGSAWILGAYGVPQICLYTNYKPDHFQNFSAFVPVNHNNNIKYIFGENKNINNINQESVLESIKEVLSK